MRERDITLDIMRFLGVLALMLAHAEPPGWLFQLRNFDVPLLIVASGATYALIYRNKPLDVVAFYKKRLARMTLPAWYFLTFFFVSFAAAFALLDRPYPFNQPYPFDLKQIVLAYLFSGGIGYVWIFKVFIMLALFTPLALTIKRSVRSNTVYFSMLIVTYAVYELALAVAPPHIPPHLSGFMNSVVFLVVPYSLLFLYGLKISELSNRQILALSAAFLLVFIAMAAYMAHDKGTFVHTQGFKYPPQLYYLAYAMCALNLIYWACRNHLSHFHYRWVEWLSANSLWIYLWHIYAIFLWKFFLPPVKGHLPLVFAKMAFLLVFGAAATLAQHEVMRRLRQLLPSRVDAHQASPGESGG